jgi:hypothetical protein
MTHTIHRLLVDITKDEAAEVADRVLTGMGAGPRMYNLRKDDPDVISLSLDAIVDSKDEIGGTCTNLVLVQVKSFDEIPLLKELLPALVESNVQTKPNSKLIDLASRRARSVLSSKTRSRKSRTSTAIDAISIPLTRPLVLEVTLHANKILNAQAPVNLEALETLSQDLQPMDALYAICLFLDIPIVMFNPIEGKFGEATSQGSNMALIVTAKDVEQGDIVLTRMRSSKAGQTTMFSVLTSLEIISKEVRIVFPSSRGR